MTDLRTEASANDVTAMIVTDCTAVINDLVGDLENVDCFPIVMSALDCLTAIVMASFLPDFPDKREAQRKMILRHADNLMLWMERFRKDKQV